MEMEFFNATKKEVEDKKYNIFIGVSLGVLKPMTEELAKDYISWALKNTKEKVVILIADEIAKFNYKIFSKYSTGKSQRRAIREGDEYIDFFKEVLKEFSKEEQENVEILRWKDIWDERKEKIRQILEQEYMSNKKFKEKVLFFIKKYAEKRGKGLKQEKLGYLSQYILYELPTLLDGIQYDKTDYRLLLYPTFEQSGMSDFATKLENGKIFPNLKKKLNLAEKTIMVEVYFPIY